VNLGGKAKMAERSEKALTAAWKNRNGMYESGNVEGERRNVKKWRKRLKMKY
jgi:hypothetical protein